MSRYITILVAFVITVKHDRRKISTDRCYNATVVNLLVGGTVIRFRLKELMADFQFTNARRLTMEELAEQTGIHRATLSKIAGRRGYSTTTDNLDRLCTFFRCPLDKLAEYIPVEQKSNET